MTTPTPITIRIPHTLGRAEARKRVETGFTNLIAQLPGAGGACTQHWDADRLSFSLAGLGQTVAGTIDVQDDALAMEIVLPGVLGLIAHGIRGRLQKAAQLLLTRQ